MESLTTSKPDPGGHDGVSDEGQQPPPQEQPQQQQQEQQEPEDLSEPLSPFDVAATGIISEPPVEIIGAEEPTPQQLQQPIILQLPFYIYTTSCKIA